MCTCILPACIYVYRVCLVTTEVGGGVVGSLGTGITGSCKLSCRSWELNLGPLQQQEVLFASLLPTACYPQARS